MERNSLVDIADLVDQCAVVVVTASGQADDAVAAIRAERGARVVFKRFAIETLMERFRP